MGHTYDLPSVTKACIDGVLGHCLCVGLMAGVHIVGVSTKRAGNGAFRERIC